MRELTHAKLVALHEAIANAHNSINGFYRFNWSEITGELRSGIQAPVLAMESHSGDMFQNSTQSANFANRRISFMLLDFTGKADNYQRQEEVLEALENVVIDIAAYLNKEAKNSNSVLWKKIDVSSIEWEKVGPIFDNMYGWNVKYTIKNHEPLCYEPDKWTWPEP